MDRLEIKLPVQRDIAALPGLKEELEVKAAGNARLRPASSRAVRGAARPAGDRSNSQMVAVGASTVRRLSASFFACCPPRQSSDIGEA